MSKVAMANIMPQAGSIAWLNACIERAKSGPFSEVVTLTPGLAAELLRRNPENRYIRPIKYQQYVADIKAGRWALNGEPIIISADGLLNDGQHRCLSVIEANRSIVVFFSFGVSRDTRTTVDQGAARTAHDYLHMEGTPNAAVQSAIARNIIAFERNGGESMNGANRITNAEILARVHADDFIADCATFAVSRVKTAQRFAPASVTGFCYYAFSDIDAGDAETYMDQVCRGESLKARDPAYTVRDRLLTMGVRTRDRQIHVIFRGWNAFRRGRKMDMAKIVGNDLPALI